MQRTLWGAEPYPDYADALNDLGLLLRDKGDNDQSEKLLQESLAMYRRLMGDRHPYVATALGNLALVQHRKGNLAEAESTFRQALALQRELLGEVHPNVASTLANLAFVIYDRGDAQGALQVLGKSLEIYRKVFPGDNPDVAATMNRLGYWYTEERDYATADRYLEEALSMRRRLFGKSSPDIASSLMHVGILQVATHKYQDALISSRAAVEIYTAARSASDWRTAVAESVSGAALTGLREYGDAEQHLIHGYTILSNDTGALPMYRILTRHYLEELYRAWGRPHDARRYATAADSGTRVVVPAAAVDDRR
jgi:tetratricopeptide (TPR) repeat protein